MKKSRIFIVIFFSILFILLTIKLIKVINSKKIFLKAERIIPSEDGEFYLFVTNKHVGVMNKKKFVVLKPEYDYISPFHDGYAIIKKDELHGIMNKNLKIIVKPKYKYINYISNELFVVIGENNKYGVVDKNGKEIIKPLYYDYISNFDLYFHAKAINTKDNKEVLIDKNGNIIQNLKKNIDN